MTEKPSTKLAERAGWQDYRRRVHRLFELRIYRVSIHFGGGWRAHVVFGSDYTVSQTVVWIGGDIIGEAYPTEADAQHAAEESLRNICRETLEALGND